MTVMNQITRNQNELSERPVVIPVEAYVSDAYARAENDRLWSKVWQIACRTEEIPRVGDYVTYEILDESIIVVRTGADEIRAFYNVCQHRGRRLTAGCGHTKQFHCRFHGWRWDINGESAFVLDKEDWGDALNAENLRLKPVMVDTWGGWAWINMDPDCVPLRQYLEPAATMMDPYQLETLRYSWRKWLYVPCNWKTALEAFNESYHTAGSHPELTEWGQNVSWCRAENGHAWHGAAGARGEERSRGSGAMHVSGGPGLDPRLSTAGLNAYLWEELRAATTETIVNAARRAVNELPADTSAADVAAHVAAMAKRDDASRGVKWAEVDPEHAAATGYDWHLFPNSVIQPYAYCSLGYRARPNGYDPDSCIFEVYVLERFPEGQEPKTEWVFEPEPSEEKWLKVLWQDYMNMPEVQKGMKSRGFKGPRPGPVQELSVINFHRTLAQYMGTGAPVEIG